MISFLFIIVTAAFFAICVLYTHALNRIARPDSAGDGTASRGAAKE